MDSQYLQISGNKYVQQNEEHEHKVDIAKQIEASSKAKQQLASRDAEPEKWLPIHLNVGSILYTPIYKNDAAGLSLPIEFDFLSPEFVWSS